MQPRTASGIFDKRDPPEAYKPTQQTAGKSPLHSDKQREIRT